MTSLSSGIVGLLATAGLAFAYVDVGSPLPSPVLTDQDGVERTLIGSQRVTAFLFFDPEQDRSREVLRALTELQVKMADAEVSWVGVVSDRFAPEAVASALEESGVGLETVIDTDDRLYGELGVRLYPTMGIADPDTVLLAYLPYTKLNYMTTVEAHLRHALGQIDDAELDTALHPRAATVGSSEAAAGRTLKFARMLWDSGKRDKALAKAREAAETAPDMADAHALVGIFLIEEGDCEEARASLAKALEIDPDHPEAIAALHECPSP